MIITRYVLLETLKSQLITLVILLIIFFCQKFIKILDATIYNKIPAHLIFSLLILNIPVMAQLILPFSLLFGLLITLSVLCMRNEIIVMYICGLHKVKLIKVAMLLALLSGMIASINVMWISPWSLRYQDKIKAEVKANPTLDTLIQGQFQRTKDSNLVLFIENVHNNCFYNMFLAQLLPKHNSHPAIMIARFGQLTQQKDGSQIITMHDGTRFEGTLNLHNFRITYFRNYKTIIGYQSITPDYNNIEQMDMHTLWYTKNNFARAEFHWRITLVFIIFIMALMVIPISAITPHQWRMFSILQIILFYLLFFLLQIYIRSNSHNNKLNPAFWMWLVNGFYLVLALLLNVWDTVIMHRVRTIFKLCMFHR